MPAVLLIRGASSAASVASVAALGVTSAAEEFEKGQFVLFTDELKSLAEESRQTIDIVSFIPERSVDTLYYEKPYLPAPDKRRAPAPGLGLID